MAKAAEGAKKLQDGTERILPQKGEGCPCPAGVLSADEPQTRGSPELSW